MWCWRNSFLSCSCPIWKAAWHIVHDSISKTSSDVDIKIYLESLNNVKDKHMVKHIKEWVEFFRKCRKDSELHDDKEAVELEILRKYKLENPL